MIDSDKFIMRTFITTDLKHGVLGYNAGLMYILIRATSSIFLLLVIHLGAISENRRSKGKIILKHCLEAQIVLKMCLRWNFSQMIPRHPRD